jgi:hypothetical protein
MLIKELGQVKRRRARHGPLLTFSDIVDKCLLSAEPVIKQALYNKTQ